MSNITLSVDDDVLRTVRKIARDRGTSVNAIVREHLASVAEMDDRLSQSLKRMRQISAKEGFEVGLITWSREDVYER